MPASTLTGGRVLLHPVRPEDGPALVQMFQEPAVAQWWPRYDAERVEHEVVGDGDPEATIYAIEVEGRVAGIVQCYEEADPDYRRASIDIAVAAEWHGKGVAVDALRTLAVHLMDDLGHHHLTIDPAADNARAIACYAKIGFRPVGVLRQNERGPDGTFHDTLLMDLVAGELR